MLSEAEDILRFQIVYVMSALDFFMHELYSYSLIKIFNNERPKTYRYNEYRVPIHLVEKALYSPEKIDKYLKEVLIDNNSHYTIMHPNKIREVLNIITREDEFPMIEDRLKEKKVIKHHERLYHILEEIYERRNKISHQTDIDHGKDARNHITKEDVKRYIDIVKHMVFELFNIVCEN